MSFYSLLIHTAQVQRMTKTKNSVSGWKEGWSDPGPPFKCRFSSYKPKDFSQLEQEKQKFIPTHSVFCLSDTDIRHDDRLIYNGKTYEVKGIMEHSSGHHLEVYVKLLA